MKRVFWITSVVAAAGVIYGLNVNAEWVERTSSTQIANIDSTAYTAPREKTEHFATMGQSGSALATAAFGMSALQPETYDGDMVASIIAASPLQEVEKVQLTSNLRQAESGYADLHSVLSDVRSALAVD